MNKPTTINPNLTVNEGKVWAHSEDVAETFEKRHDNVLRAIDNLEIPVDFRRLNFEETVKLRENPVTGCKQESRAVLMTRDGFTLLAMGFTGKRAMAFKLAYIEAFNRMEAELRGQSPSRAAAIPPLASLTPDPQSAGRPGPDWFTIREISEEWGISPRTTQARMSALVAAGRAEVRPTKKPRRPWHYRFLAADERSEAEEPGGRRLSWDDVRKGKPFIRFLGHVDDNGRIELRELTNECVFSMEELPKRLADSAVFLHGTLEEQRRLLHDIARSATMRAAYGGNTAYALLFGGDADKRAAVNRIVCLQQQAVTKTA